MTTAYADAACRILEGGPYSDSIIHLPNATMGASSHGYVSPKEARAYFEMMGWDYPSAWTSEFDAKARLELIADALKAEADGKHTYTVGPGGLFDWCGRPVVVWQLAIVMRGASLWRLIAAHEGPDSSKALAFIHNLSGILIRRCAADILTHGMGAGYDSEDKPVPAVPWPHDAFQARVPLHKEPDKGGEEDTTLWHIPAACLAKRSGALGKAACDAFDKMMGAIMEKATPSPQQQAETCWPWFAQKEGA